MFRATGNICQLYFNNNTDACSRDYKPVAGATPKLLTLRLARCLRENAAAHRLWLRCD